jgi:hypothetical protein
VPITAWQQGIRRAEHLAAQHPFAAGILRFYIHTARFQEGLYQRIEHVFGNRNSVSLSAPLELPELFASVPQFLSVVEENGPARLAQLAHGLRQESSHSWSSLLNASWSATGEPPSDPENS